MLGNDRVEWILFQTFRLIFRPERRAVQMEARSEKKTGPHSGRNDPTRQAFGQQQNQVQRKDGVADGTRTRNSQLHKLGLYH